MVEKMYSPEKVAEILEVSPNTVRSWLRDGELKGVKVGRGRLWRISEPELNRFTGQYNKNNNSK